MRQCLLSLLWLPLAQCDFGQKGAGKDLLGGLQVVQWHLFENASGPCCLALGEALIGRCQAQLGGFRRIALIGLLQQLLRRGLRCARQLTQRG